MSFNNAVYDARGNTIGFRCSLCGAIRSSMWGTTCNGCRQAQESQQELTDILKSLANKA